MKNKSLDGLRGLAALTVTIGHFVFAFLPALLNSSFPQVSPSADTQGMADSILSLPFISLAYGGHFAVLVFFVLSGYVLTMPYFNGGDDLILKRRLFGRYIRLNLPALVAILLSFLICKAGLYYNVEASQISGSMMFIGDYFTHDISLSSMLEAGFYKSILLGDKTYQHPLWTLPYEFIGSILLLGFYICKPRQRDLIITVAAILLLLVLFKAYALFYMAIFAGALLNKAKLHTKWNAALAVAGLYFGAFQYANPIYDFWPAFNYGGMEMWSQITFYNTVGAILLVAAVANGFGKRLLEHRIVQFLGEISFPMYLLHFLILCSVTCAIYLSLPQTGIYLIVNLFAYLLLCIGASKIFSIYVDKPAIKLSHKFSDYLFKDKPAG